ncbi:MAG: glycosyltransferase family 2 protein [Lachnospiraceae bacterium]
MVKVSVIVPVYQVEKYIHRCVDSILHQTLTEIEVILVEDGSPDNCGSICEEYARVDQRIQVVHKTNGGLSDARNAGIALATGETVIFIDSDDYVEEQMLEYLYENLCATGADMATCGVYDVYEDGIESSKQQELFVCDATEAYRYIMLGEIIRGEIWNKLIRRTYAVQLLFPKGKLFEDIYYTADLMPLIQTVCVGTTPQYYYVHRAESITGKAYRPQIHDIIEGYTKNYQVVRQYFPTLQEEAEYLWIWSRFLVLDKMLLEENYRKLERYQEVVLFIKRHLIAIMKNPCFNNKRRIATGILFINVRLYRKIVIYRSTKKRLITERI